MFNFGPFHDELKTKAEQMVYPEFGGNAELRSLLYHSQLATKLDGLPPSYLMKQAIIDEVCETLSFAKWTIPDNWLSFENFCVLIQDVDPDASPGYPYCTRVTSNGQLLGYNNGFYDEAKVRDLYEKVMFYAENGTEPDYIRLFIKPEAHSLKKQKDRRWRLISSVSIRDRMLDAMLFSSFNQRLLETWPESPIKVGWTPIRGGWKMLTNVPTHSTDCSSWDWTVPAWLFEVILEIRIKMCTNMTEEWKRLAVKRYRDLFEQPWFVASNGVTLRQLFSGVQKSGCFNTIIDNSIGQLVLHVFACITLGLNRGTIWCCGDDKKNSPQPQEYYDFLGQYCIIKELVDAIEFCGYRFEPGGKVEPVHVLKHAFNIFHMSPKIAESMAMSYSILYHRSERKKEMKELFAELDLQGLSDFQLDALWDDDHGIF